MIIEFLNDNKIYFKKINCVIPGVHFINFMELLKVVPGFFLPEHGPEGRELYLQ
jgi:hypothetical protein